MPKMKITENRFNQLILLLFAAVFFMPPPVSAGNFSITMENDFFGSAGTDRYYTNGLNLTYVTDHNKKWLAAVGDFSNSLDAPFVRRISYIGGQDIYTPQDIEDINLIEDDRPYSGWLYLGMGIHDRTVMEEEGASLSNSPRQL